MGNQYISSPDGKYYSALQDKNAVIQRGGSWDELPQEIKDYYAKHASDKNPLPFNAETVEKIAKELKL